MKNYPNIPIKSKKEYTAFARFYDKAMNKEKYQTWDDLIREMVQKYSVPKGWCLDIACGTGQISKRLLEQGFKVVGVDKSKAMLEIAKKRAPKAEYLEADIRDFKANREFPLAVSFYDSLNYLLTDEDMLKTFKNVHAHLSKDGIFLFDMNTKDDLAVCQKMKPDIFKGKDYYFVFQHGGDGRKWVIDIELFTKKKDGSYERFHERHVERGYDDEDICPLLEKAGFDVLEVRRERRTSKERRKYFSRLYFVAKKRN